MGYWMNFGILDVWRIGWIQCGILDELWMTRCMEDRVDPVWDTGCLMNYYMPNGFCGYWIPGR